jgi:adenosylcobinamide-phosphate synthase
VAAAAIPHALGVLLAAFVLDAVLAWLPGLREVLRAPAEGTARLAGWFGARLNRARRGAGTRFMRGLVVVVVIAAAAWALGWLVTDLAGEGEKHRADVVAVVAVMFLAGVRAPFDGALRTRRGMAEDDHAAARVAIEGLAIGLATRVVGVTFWYLLLDLPGLCLYRAVDAVAGRIGRDGGPFGRPAAMFDAVLGFIPGTIAGWLIALAASFAPRGRPLAALSTMLRTRAKLPLWDPGGTTAAMAGAFGFALGGGPWIGDGRARLLAQDVRNAAYLYAVAFLIHMGAMAGTLLAYSPI